MEFLSLSTFLTTAATVWSKVWPILFAILLFGFIIFSHELGHFLFAKLFKVKVNEFAIGMGPAFFKKQRGETLYALRAFPIGGYVAMEGEDEDSDDERAFGNAKTWKKIIIVAAGAVFNLIIGFLIVAVMLTQEDLIGTQRIYGFQENAVSVNYGLEKDDLIRKINGRHVFSQYDVSFLMSRDKDGVMDFVVERDGKKVALDGIKFDTKKSEDGKQTIIFDFIVVGVKPTVLSVAKYSVLQSISIARMVWISLFDLITGRYGFSDLSGPIGTVTFIAEAAKMTTKVDLTPILTMMSLITINIGIFNLLPIPALDGGRLLFLFIELIRRKKMNQKYEKWVHAVGLILLLALMAAVSFSDILKLVRGELV
ncbi:MAG: M50 family metallopeptidase [Clostridiales bacterium]|nr:M50 family metallopeptidase [Clostridiales bacterium]